MSVMPTSPAAFTRPSAAPVEIVSHPLCPHCHRLVLIATAAGWRRGEDYAVTYLPYATLRETAPTVAPGGALPAFYVGGAYRTSRSEAAAEYLDGVTGLGLVPADPARRLTVRERERRASLLLDAMRAMFAEQTPAAVGPAVDAVFDHLDAADADLASDGTTERTMRMDMAALEPAFTLLNFFPQLRDHPRWGRIPRLRDIGRRSGENPWLQASATPSYAHEFEEFFEMTRSAFPAVVLAGRRWA